MEKVLGIDPGYGRLGWAVVLNESGKDDLIEAGCFETPKQMEYQKRLGLIGAHIKEILARHTPTTIAMEKLFLKHNRKSALKVAEVRGIVLEHTAGLILYEFAPAQIKLNICGYGKADKKQVQKMVMLILRLSEFPKPDDKADAIAVALCGSRMVKWG